MHLPGHEITVQGKASGASEDTPLPGPAATRQTGNAAAWREEPHLQQSYTGERRDIAWEGAEDEFPFRHRQGTCI